MPAALYEEVIEVDERLIPQQPGCRLPGSEALPRLAGCTGDTLLLWRPLDLMALRRELERVLARGIHSLAVLLLHSYAWPGHEEQVGALARELGFQHVSLSSAVTAMARAVPRGHTACADAYLTPCIRRYLDGFCAGFAERLRGVPVLFMRSDGGLTPMQHFSGARAVLSGPAGGVVGYAVTTYRQQDGQPVIGFDMGGGPPTVTDANLCLGRLLPEFFPRIFGPGEDQPLCRDAALRALRGLAERVGAGAPGQHPMSVEEVAMGFIRVANEAMCRPIRALTQARGHDTSRHVLACFGGAGGQHACAIARALGMKKVFIHKYSGVLSAYGMALADVVHEAQVPCALRYEPAAFAQLDERIAALEQECRQALAAQGFSSDQIRTEAFLHLRYERTDCALMCSAKGHPPTPSSCRAGDFAAAFASRCVPAGTPGSGWGLPRPATLTPSPCHRYRTEFGFTIPDRAVVVDDVRVRGTGSTGISCESPLAPSGEPPRVETVTRCYFEEGYLETPHHPGGAGLHRQPDGARRRLHRRGLGAAERRGHAARPRAALHLLPPLHEHRSRGHHADIGGITPGSMPPHSKALHEEGAVFVSFKLVKDGVFQEEAVTEALMAPGRVAGCSGTRNLQDNLSDLRAQVAANQKGIQLVAELIGLYGLGVVQAYMGHIQANAELAVREMLRGFAARWGAAVEAEDRMDDGSPIRLRVQVDPQEGSAVFDFSGSGHEVYGNCNAPRAITLSALIYCLRCMVGQDIPLNQGCLAPVRVVIPKGSILDPSPEAAVVGGNVLTSQRVVDVIFKAFGVCAASQGCMNNVTFGNERVGYYETVAGGAGAGPRWHGRSGRFELRRGSGGAGRYRGGDGVCRELLFRQDMVLSVLSERRAIQPYGLRGGSPGALGLNLLLRRDGPTINLGAKTSVPVQPGDVFCLQTPGGGGFGPPGDAGEAEDGAEPAAPRSFAERGSLFEYRRAQEAV
ncbi:5-oxoprolinase [Aix galericulata]|nr:5-oxoprolinase [Aix galericulata]